MASVTWTCPYCDTENADTRPCAGDCPYVLSQRDYRKLARRAELAEALPGAEALEEGVDRPMVAFLVLLAVLVFVAAPFIPGLAGAVTAVPDESIRTVDTADCAPCEGSAVSAMALRVQPKSVFGLPGGWSTEGRIYFIVERPDPSGIRFAVAGVDETVEVGSLGKDGKVWVSEVEDATLIPDLVATLGLGDKVTIAADDAASVRRWSAGSIRGMDVHDISSPLSNLPWFLLGGAGVVVVVVAFRQVTVTALGRRTSLLFAVVTATVLAGWLGPNIAYTFGRATSVDTYSTGLGLTLTALYGLAIVGLPFVVLLISRDLCHVLAEVLEEKAQPFVTRLVAAGVSIALVLLIAQHVDQALASTFVGLGS